MRVGESDRALEATRALALECHRGPLLVALFFIFLLMSASVNGQQGAPVAPAQISQETAQPQMRMPASIRMDCTYLENALRAAEQRIERDERIIKTSSPPEGEVNLQYDLKVLEHD